MSLSIGTLVGYVTIDTSEAEQTLAALPGKMAFSGKAWAKVLEVAGRSAGKGAADGMMDLLNSLPKDAQGVVSKTSDAFKALSPAMQASVLDAKNKSAAALGELPDDAEGAGESSGEALGNGLMRMLPELLTRFEGKYKAGLAVVATTAGAAFAASLYSAMDIEPSRDRVAAALDLTAEDAKRAGRVSGKLYADAWGESAGDIDAAVEAVMSSIGGMRDASEADLTDVTQAALVLSTAMGVDVVRASQVAGNMIKNGLAANGKDAMDLLSAAMSKVPVQLREDVLDATDEYGQFFNALGIDGPKAMALLAAGADKGTYGIDKMGDAVKEFTIRATDGSKNTSVALEGLGLDFVKVQNDLLAGGSTANKAFDQVVSALLQIEDPAALAQDALILFGTPLEDLSTKDIPAFLKSMQTGAGTLEDFSGTTDRMGKTLNDNAKTNLAGFTRKVQTGLVDLIGGKVLPKLTEWSAVMDKSVGPGLRAIGNAVATVTKFLVEHKGIALTLVGVMGALAAVTAAHAVVLGVSSGAMAAWFMGTKLITAATRTWAATMWVLNSSFLANPIVLIVLGVMALIAAVVLAYNKVGWFKTGVDSAFKGIKIAVSAVMTWFSTWVPKVFSVVKTVISTYVTTYLAIVKRVFSLIKGAVVLYINGVKTYITTVVGAIKAVFNGMSTIVTKVKSVFGAVKREMVSIFKGIVNSIIAMWNSIDFAINISVPKWVPKIGGKGFKIDDIVPDIPGLATGGRVTSDTIARIGEGREPESVLPDSMLRGLLERAHEAGKASGDGRREGGNTWQVYQQPNESAAVLRERLWFMMRTRPA